MRVVVTAVGRLKAGPERALAERYAERAAKAGRGLGFKAIDIVEIGESRAARPEDRMAEEALGLVRALPDGAVRIALDGSGAPLASDQFAARLGQWRDAGRVAAGFLIGGADGLAADIKAGADLTLAFGAATWPHQLVRIMLLEQLYRAVTILAGHPYHRA